MERVKSPQPAGSPRCWRPGLRGLLERVRTEDWGLPPPTFARTARGCATLFSTRACLEAFRGSMLEPALSAWARRRCRRAFAMPRGISDVSPRVDL
jgi:hypothetical protein